MKGKRNTNSPVKQETKWKKVKLETHKRHDVHLAYPDQKHSGGFVSATASATNLSGKVAKKMSARQLYESLKAQGYKTKSAALEEVLKKTEKRKAELIGYDEEAPSIDSNMLENSQSDCDMKVYPLKLPGQRKDCKTESPTIRPNSHSKPKQKRAGPLTSASAKSRLHEICAANCWKPPTFECVEERGSSHLEESVFMIKLEIGERPNHLFEIYGETRMKKEDAAESAAEGALWFLKNEGYLQD